MNTSRLPGLAFALALLLAAAGCASAPSQPLSEATARDTNADRILVTVASLSRAETALSASGRLAYRPRDAGAARVPLRRAQQLAEEYGLTLEEDWPISALAVHCFVFRLAAADSREQILSRLQARADIDSAQPLQFFHGESDAVNERGDPLAEWNAELHQRLRAVHERTTGATARVAIIDTGVDLAHEDLEGMRFVAMDLVDGLQPMPAETHGTAVVGLLAARPANGVGLRGYAPDANLVLLRACWEADRERETAVCNTFTIAKAMSLALETGTDIVNLSISGPRDPLLERLGKKLVERGLILVAAGESAATFPASIQGSVIAARYAHSPLVGGIAMTLLPADRYGIRNGSSIAAAKVTSIAALMKQLLPAMSGAELDAALTAAPGTVMQGFGQLFDAKPEPLVQ